MGFPARLAISRCGGKEGQAVLGRKPCKDLVTTNQRPLNGGCWRVSSRSFMERFMLEFSLSVRITIEQVIKLGRVLVVIMALLV